jgi:hypothetical protein
MKLGTRFTLALAAAMLALAPSALGHCDAEDGPVIVDARAALARGDVAPVLKWIPASDEAEIRSLFEQVVRVRATGDDAKALADKLFLETLVRLHRESEGEAFDGIKAAGLQEPLIAKIDASLRDGSGDALIDAVAGHVRREVSAKFSAATKAAELRDTSAEAGRAWVASYVELVHLVKGIHDMLEGSHGHGAAAHAAHGGGR